MLSYATAVLKNLAVNKVDQELAQYFRIIFTFRYEHDPRGSSKEKFSVLSSDIDDAFGLQMHQEDGLSCLIAAIPGRFSNEWKTTLLQKTINET